MTTSELPARALIVIAAEGEQTADYRIVEPGALTWRTPPLTLTRNHDDDQIVGRIDHIWRSSTLYTPEEAADIIAAADVNAALDSDSGDLIYGLVTFDLASEAGADAARMVQGGFLRGVSMEAGDVVAEYECLDGEDEDGFCEGEMLMRLLSGRIGQVTLTGFQAIESAAVVLAASAAPEHPPVDWFTDPALDEPTPLTITDDGRVFGHLATWGTCHTGRTDTCVTAPRSRSNYAYFRTGAVICDDGTEVPVGSLTVGGLHAPRLANAADTVAHYENTARAVADVAAGEDAHGIWVAGTLRPDATPEQVRQLRAGSLSGDWRRIGGTLELVAALAVNVPGFPVPRPQVGLTASGVQVSLTSAPAPTRRRCGCGESGLEARVRQLEAVAVALGHRDAARAALASRVRP